MRARSVALLCCATLAGLGCFGPSGLGPSHGSVPVPMVMSSPEYAKFAKAIAAVDRKAKGFSPIDPKADVMFEGPGDGYDAMLHFYSHDDPRLGYRWTDRTIGFRRAGTGYRWSSEQESHYGPRTYHDADGGETREMLSLDYDTEPTNGVPVGVTSVCYFGEDPRLALPKEPTLKEALAVLKEWQPGGVGKPVVGSGHRPRRP